VLGGPYRRGEWQVLASAEWLTAVGRRHMAGGRRLQAYTRSNVIVTALPSMAPVNVMSVPEIA